MNIIRSHPVRNEVHEQLYEAGTAAWTRGAHEVCPLSQSIGLPPQNTNTLQGLQGYWIKAYRGLTSVSHSFIDAFQSTCPEC